MTYKEDKEEKPTVRHNKILDNAEICDPRGNSYYIEQDD